MSNEDKPTFIPCIRDATFPLSGPIYTLHPRSGLHTRAIDLFH